VCVCVDVWCVCVDVWCVCVCVVCGCMCVCVCVCVCVMPSTAVFCSSLMSRFQGMLPTYFLNNFEIVSSLFVT